MKKDGLLLPGIAFALATLSSPAQADLPPPVASGIKTGTFGRVVDADNKRVTKCPRQDRRTAVLLIAGQSNAANYATTPYRSRYGDRIVNFFAGKCYLASSPLLGADGPWGEYWTELANELVSSGQFNRVILISSAIGGTSINSWRADRKKPSGQDLNSMLINVLQSARPRYRITHVLWHQGEADTDMPVDDYRKGFLSLVTSLRQHGVRAPVFVSITSASGGNPPVVQAQRSLPNAAMDIWPGVDTDALVKPEERNVTGHFGPTAERKVVKAWLDLLQAYSSRHPH